jgi:hemoglobin
MQDQEKLLSLAKTRFYHQAVAPIDWRTWQSEAPMRTLRLLPGMMALAALTFWSASSQAQEKKPVAEKHDTQALSHALREVINTGADLFNLHGDYAGCYRIYQGALLSIKPFLAAELRSKIDATIERAERLPRYSDRAFELRALIDDIRAQSKATVTTAEEKKTAEKAEKKATPKTLWDRLGGEGGVRNIVDEFILQAGPDPKVNMSRNGKFKLDEKNVAVIKKQLVAFISSISGGPISYEGRNMKEAHKGMAITNAEYDAAVGHFKGAMDRHGIKPADVKAVLSAVESLRKDIIEPQTLKKDEPKAPPKKAKKGAVSAEPSGQVMGKVTVNGKPAPPGFLTFVGAEQRRFSTSIVDGTYEFKTPIPVGTYRIAIERVPGAKIPANLDIPEKYRNEATSGLTIRVQRGKQTFDLDLK